MRGNLGSDLICISLIAKDVEHIFMYLLAIVFFFKNYIQSVVPFSDWMEYFWHLIFAAVYNPDNCCRVGKDFLPPFYRLFLHSSGFFCSTETCISWSFFFFFRKSLPFLYLQVFSHILGSYTGRSWSIFYWFWGVLGDKRIWFYQENSENKCRWGFGKEEHLHTTVGDVNLCNHCGMRINASQKNP